MRATDLPACSSAVLHGSPERVSLPREDSMRVQVIFGIVHAWMEGQDFHRHCGLGYSEQEAIEDWRKRQ